MTTIMKSLFKALCAICILLTCASCSWMPCIYDILGSDTPYFEGGDHKHFDSKEQKHSFRIITGCGKSFKGLSWSIIDVKVIESSTDKIDTLSNGDLKVSHDWVSFLIQAKKSTIEVSVSENKTGQARSVRLAIDRYKRNLPNLTITQSAE